MNNGIPDWWLVVTGIAGVCIALFFVAMVVMLGMIIKLIKDMEPKISGLVTKVDTLVEKVDGIAASTKVTVDNVGGHAKGIATSVEHITAIAAANFARFAPVLGLLSTGFKVYGMIREVRGQKKVNSVKVRPKGDDELVIDLGKDGKNHVPAGKMGGRRGVEQSGSSSGS